MAPSATTIVRQRNEDIDDAGNRTVYHSGDGLKLMSFVDSKGRLLRATCVLKNDIISWHHGAKLRTGVVKSLDADPNLADFDKMPSGMRLERVRSVIGSYSGDDKYVKQFGRLLLTFGGFASADVVTGMGYAGEIRKRKQRANAQKRGVQVGALMALGVGLVFALLWALTR
jgi:hypothetical protein